MVEGRTAPPGVHVIADFVFGSESDLCGIFVFENEGILSGIEVFGYAVDAPKTLPAIETLRPISFQDGRMVERPKNRANGVSSP